MKNQRPNIIYLFADQLGYFWTGFGGDGSVKTPRLDKLARESVNFTRAYSNSPVCTPYRGILMTGRYPTQTGICQNGYRIPDGERTLARCFNDAGYLTSYLGKWHLSGPGGLNEWVPPALRAGFADFTGWESHHINHWEGKIFSDDDPRTPLDLEGHETEGLTDRVLDKLDELSRQEKPFLFMVAYQAPHFPCAPPEEYEELYEDVPFPLRPNCDDGAEMAKPHWPVDQNTLDFVDQCWRKPMVSRRFQELYFAEITQLDHQIGRILDKLDETGLADNSVLVFTADHGEMAGSHGRFGKGVMLEESVRVPLIIRCPSGHRVERGDRNAPVSTVDLMPTLLEAAGIDIPTSCEGSSLAAMPVDGLLEERPIFFDLDDLAVLRGYDKLILDRESGDVKGFYRLDDDPYEQNNLADSPDEDHRRTREALKAEIETWRRDILTRPGEPEKAKERYYGVNHD